MLLVFFPAVVAAREREDQRIAALELAERADGAGVAGQRVIGGKMPPGVMSERMG